MRHSLSPTRRQRWLVVDDNEQLGELINLWLIQLGGAAVERFTSAADALATSQTDPQDIALLVTDRDMPGMSGLELAQRMHAHTPTLKVIMVTANHSGLTREVLDRAGVFATLAKPFSLRRLEALVRAATDEPVLFGRRLDTHRCTCAA